MLIELEELKHKINNSKYYGTDAWRDILDMAVDCDSKVRPRGEWIVDEEQGTSTCSNCGIVWQFTDGTNGSNYCPNCGADMRGDEHE